MDTGAGGRPGGDWGGPGEPRAHRHTDGADGEDKDGHRTPGQHFHGPGKRLLSPPAFTHSKLLF